MTDFEALLRALTQAGVDFIVVGAEPVKDFETLTMNIYWPIGILSCVFDPRSDKKWFCLLETIPSSRHYKHHSGPVPGRGAGSATPTARAGTGLAGTAWS